MWDGVALILSVAVSLYRGGAVGLGASAVTAAIVSVRGCVARLLLKLLVLWGVGDYVGVGLPRQALAGCRVDKTVLGRCCRGIRVAALRWHAVLRNPRLHGVLPVPVLAVAYGVARALRVAAAGPVQNVVDAAVAAGYLPDAV